MAKLTKKKLKFFIADEKHADKEYRHYGLPNLAKDERKHKRFLTKILREQSSLGCRRASGSSSKLKKMKQVC